MMPIEMGTGRVGRFFSDDRIQPPKDGNARGVGNDKRLRRKRGEFVYDYEKNARSRGQTTPARG